MQMPQPSASELSSLCSLKSFSESFSFVCVSLLMLARSADHIHLVFPLLYSIQAHAINRANKVPTAYLSLYTSAETVQQVSDLRNVPQLDRLSE
ncbi:hypothetical protein BDV09DRAFT_2300 [Aspergillus tetrazonus]